MRRRLASAGSPQFLHFRLGPRRQHRRVLRVRRRADEVELSLAGAAVLERDLAFAETDVETVERAERMPRGSHPHGARGADVEDANFTTLKEKARARLLGAGQHERGGGGHGGPDDHPVEVRVVRGDLAGLKQPGEHKLLAQ